MEMEFERITSRKNPKIIGACALSDKKFRDREGLYCFEGEKLFREALSEKQELTEVFFNERAMDSCRDMLLSAYGAGARLYCVTPEVYEKLTYEKAAQGIFAVAKKKELQRLSENSDFSSGFIVLESVRDPSNVGAVIRSCAALGCRNVLLTSDCADVYGYKTLRSAMGTVFKTNILVTDDIKESIELLKKHGKVYAAALTDNAVSIAETDFCASDSIIIGNEGHGVSEAVQNSCSGTVIIPMQCGTESLNASVAAAILIWEKARKTNMLYSDAAGK